MLRRRARSESARRATEATESNQRRRRYARRLRYGFMISRNRAGGARLIRPTLGNGYVRILYTGRNVDVVWPRGDSPLKGSSPAAGRGIQRC